MNGIVMWGILGALISIVIGFLIVSAFLDRKKRKLAKIEKAENDKMKETAVGNLSIIMNILIENNNKKLKDFVPSVGELKMSDINNMAKDEIKYIKATKWFRFLKEEDILMDNFSVFIKEKSNNWSKKNIKQIKYFQDLEKSIDKETYKEFKSLQKTRFEKRYK